MARRPRQKIRKTPEFDVIEIKWLTGFPYEGQHPALDNHSFCLYAVHGIRYTQKTPRLQYIGQTIQTVRQRFNDQNHKVHKVQRQRTIAIGNIVAPATISEEHLDLAEHVMIFKHEPPLCERLIWTPPHHPIVIQSDWYTCDVNNYQNQNLHQLFKTDLICWNENQEFYWETYDEDGELVDEGEFDL